MDTFTTDNMKTITIPLELAEEILRVTVYMTDSANIFVPEYYHKLKKLVEDKHTYEQWKEADAMIDKMEKLRSDTQKSVEVTTASPSHI